MSYEDRTRLRAIVRKNMPHLFVLDDSNRHLDQVIDSIGPKVMRAQLMRALAAGKVG